MYSLNIDPGIVFLYMYSTSPIDQPSAWQHSQMTTIRWFVSFGMRRRSAITHNSASVTDRGLTRLGPKSKYQSANVAVYSHLTNDLIVSGLSSGRSSSPSQGKGKPPYRAPLKKPE